MSLDLNPLTAVQASEADLSKNKQSKLSQACREFEALFIAQMLKVMRQTTGGEVGGWSLGAANPFQEMFDWELAVRLSERSPLGVAEALLRQYQQPQEINLNNLKDDADAIPLKDAAPKPVSLPVVNNRRPLNKTPQEKYPDLENIIQRAAERYELDPNLVRAVIACESGFDTTAVSDKGAKGLMQLIDSTAADLGVNDPFDPEANVFGGAFYLRQLWDRYQGNPQLALAAYNAGPGAVDRYRGIPPYAETTAYVRKVLNAWKNSNQDKNQ